MTLFCEWRGLGLHAAQRKQHITWVTKEDQNKLLFFLDKNSTRGKGNLRREERKQTEQESKEKPKQLKSLVEEVTNFVSFVLGLSSTRHKRDDGLLCSALSVSAVCLVTGVV